MLIIATDWSGTHILKEGGASLLLSQKYGAAWLKISLKASSRAING
jgi:hypothetical protein